MSSSAKSYSRKQAGVIYRAIKEGKIEMSKDAISAMYDNCDYIDVYSRLTADLAINGVPAIKNAVTFIFEGNYENAQVSINNFASLVA